LAAVEMLAKAAIPVSVMMAPIVPGLTDHEIPAVLQAAADAGAMGAAYVPLRLPLAVAPLFENWLARHFPDRKEKVLNRIRSLRGGKLNDPNFNSRMRGEGIWAEQLKVLFESAKRRSGLDQRQMPELSLNAFRNAGEKQMKLW
jgi:DNA repair photolyase